MSTLIKMYEPSSVTSAWKLQSHQLGVLWSISLRDFIRKPGVRFIIILIIRYFRYVKDGSLWEGMMPFWKSDNNQYITPDPLSNPIMYYIKWVVSESVGGFNAGLQNNAYTDGYNCPYEIPDQWEYEYQRQWYVDPTLTFKCTKTRDD